MTKKKQKTTVTNLRKKNAKRRRTLRATERGLLSKAGSQQRKLNRFMLREFIPTLDISNNTVVYNQQNLRKVNTPSKIKNFIKTVVNKFMRSYYMSSFDRINSKTLGYYNEFQPTKEVKKKVLERAEITVNGFINDLFDNNTIYSNLQNTLRKAVTTSQNVTQLKDTLTKQIKGRENALGLVQSYHYEHGYNEFQAYSRGLDAHFSEELRLNYALYAGTEIKTTRHFCNKRVGKVYTREEILTWNDEEWQGKKDGHKILIDLGGWNCRHDLDWMTYELAKRLRKNIQKSNFDL